jgi:hypothetical protein
VDRYEPVTVTMTRSKAVERDSPASREGSGPLRLEAVPVSLVPQVDPVRHTADLVYELLPNTRTALLRQASFSAGMGFDGAARNPFLGPALLSPSLPPLAKDQMLRVLVPLGERQTESVVPYAAVVYDVHGGAWIYLELPTNSAGKHVFERRRVELGASSGEGVAIRPSCKPGERVVVTGAGALFSREFHRPPVDEE